MFKNKKPCYRQTKFSAWKRNEIKESWEMSSEAGNPPVFDQSRYFQTTENLSQSCSQDYSYPERLQLSQWSQDHEKSLDPDVAVTSMSLEKYSKLYNCLVRSGKRVQICSEFDENLYKRGDIHEVF